ncbi:MAG: hypothetical protein IH948_02175 [Bacteroidetes bacterium]|nr:hypothetical protein [Bacteroidota bacterium]
MHRGGVGQREGAQRHHPSPATSTGQGMDEILEDYNKRIKILQWMFEHDIHNYKETTKIIGQYYREPKQVMQKIESEA